MPRGEPTRTVRLPVWLLDHLADEAGGADAVPALITKRLAPRQQASPLGPAVRCRCAKPTLSKVATNICTTCKLVRA